MPPVLSQMNRLAFAVKAAPNEFKKFIDERIRDLEDTAVYFDNMILQ